MSAPSSPKPNITAAPDGPYLVKDLATLSNQRGPIETRPVIALCRCGASSNKPFCDGSHWSIEFQDEQN